MNIKLSLFIILAAFGCNVQAETIRERLQQAKQTADTESENLMLELLAMGVTNHTSAILLGAFDKGLEQNIKSKEALGYSSFNRSRLLGAMINCVEQNELNAPEREVAESCFNKLSTALDKNTFKSLNEKQVLQNELKKIKQII